VKGRFGFLIGLGAGYVLGSKAGHERYEQLRRLYDNLISSPGFRQATGRAKEAVESGFEQARDKAAEGVSKVTGRGEPQPGLSVAPPPST
jgi:hypothetical protein